MIRRILFIASLVGVTIASLFILSRPLVNNDTASQTIIGIDEPQITPTPDLMARLPIKSLQLQTNQIDALSLNPDQLNLYALLWSNDGKRLFAIGEEAIITFDISLAIDGGWLVGRLSASALSLSNDGRLLAALTTDNYLRIWETQEGIELGQLRLDDTLSRVHFTGDEITLIGDEQATRQAYQLADNGLIAIEIPPSAPLILPVRPIQEATSARHPDLPMTATITGTNQLALVDDKGITQYERTITSIPARQTIRLAPATSGVGCSILAEEACDR